jgi:DNA-binding NarL/FixJ family response regulator
VEPGTIEHFLREKTLSRRQIDVAKGILRGFSDKEIAIEVGLGEKTVRSYCGAIYKKLGVNSRGKFMIACAQFLPLVAEDASEFDLSDDTLAEFDDDN